MAQADDVSNFVNSRVHEIGLDMMIADRKLAVLRVELDISVQDLARRSRVGDCRQGYDQRAMLPSLIPENQQVLVARWHQEIESNEIALDETRCPHKGDIGPIR